LPEERAGLVAHEPVQDAARLLRLHLALVYLTGVLDGTTNGIARDLVKENALHRRVLRYSTATADVTRHVPRNRLTLSIRVGGEDHLTCVARRALELRERLLLALDCH